MSIEGNPPAALTVTDAFFSGGARILHNGVAGDLHTSGEVGHSFLSIHSAVFREDTLQYMYGNTSYLELVERGIEVRTLGRAAMNGPDMNPFSIFELALFKQMADNADLVLTLKEQPIRLLLAAAEAGMDLKNKPVLTCLHRSDPENQGRALDDLAVAIQEGIVDGFTTSSYSSLNAYDQYGIPASKGTVILNGIDLDKFYFKPSARAVVRDELGIPVNAPTVLLAARYDTMKNIPLFLSAARHFLAAEPTGHIMMCGAGMSVGNTSLLDDIVQEVGPSASAHERIHLLDIQKNMPEMYSATDIVALTSAFGETYPLCLLEGMACGAIGVSTDVGDTTSLLEGRGIITTQDPEDIAINWQQAFANRDKLRLTPVQRQEIGHHEMNRHYKKVFDHYTHSYDRSQSIPTPLSVSQ